MSQAQVDFLEKSAHRLESSSQFLPGKDISGSKLGLRSNYLRYGVALTSRLLKIIGLCSNEPYKRDDILQKRHIILRSQLIEATPYVCNSEHVSVVTAAYVLFSTCTFKLHIHVHYIYVICLYTLFIFV